MMEDTKRYVVTPKMEGRQSYLCYFLDGKIIPVHFDDIPGANRVAEALSDATDNDWQVHLAKPIGDEAS